MARCKHCRKHFENRAVVNGHDEVLYGYCSRGCFQADDPQGYAEWLEKKRQDAERQTAMQKKIFEILRSAARWYWGLRRKSMPAFWTVTAILVAAAIAAFWFRWLKPHRQELRELAEERARMEQAERLERETEECSAFVNGLGKEGKPAPAEGVQCPSGGQVEFAVRGNTKAAHDWDPDLPVLYSLKCALHGTEYGTDDNLTDFDDVGKYAFRLGESMESNGGKTKAGAAFHSLFSPAEIGKFASVRAVRGPDGRTLSVDPYTSVATAKARLSFDGHAYEAWAARLSAKLKPFAVETERTLLVQPQDDGRGTAARQTAPKLAPEKRFDRGHPLYIVRDAGKLTADVLLFDDDTWKGLRAAIKFNLQGEDLFQWRVEGGVSLANGKTALAEAHVNGLLTENVVLPRFSSHQGGGLAVLSPSETASVEFKWNDVKRNDASAKPVYRLNLLPGMPYVQRPSKIDWSKIGKDAEPEPVEESAPEPKAVPAPEPAEKTAPEEKAEPKAKPAPGSAPAPKPGSTPTPAKKTTLTDLADRQATAYKEGTKTVEQIVEVIKSPKLTEPQRKRLRELLEERGVPLAEAERKAKEEAKRKADEEAEARRKAAAEAEAKRKAAEEAEAKRKADEERKAAEFKARREKAEAERLKRQEEDRKRREEAERQAKEEAEREQKRKDDEARDLQKSVDDFTKRMRQLSMEAAKNAGMDDEEEGEDVDELEEANADNPFFRDGRFQPESSRDEPRSAAEAMRRRAEAVEAQRRAAAGETRRSAPAEEAPRRAEAAEARRRAEAVEAKRRAAVAEAQRRAEAERKLEEARKAELAASQVDSHATPPAMPDAMAEQLAAGIKMSVEGGQMTAAQAAFMLDNAMLSDAQKAKVRKLLDAEGITLPGGK